MKQETSHKPIIVVLGMHRSGTSVVTRVFNLLGANLGKNLMVPAEDNPAGLWESAEIVAIHDEMLLHLGYSWDDPRPFPESWWTRPDLKGFTSRMEHFLGHNFSKFLYKI